MMCILLRYNVLEKNKDSAQEAGVQFQTQFP